MLRTILATAVLLSGTQAVFAQQKDIVDTAVSAGSFKTLVAAVQAAGLVETLKGDGPFTVFAPTDEAFAKIPKEVLGDLLKPENKAKLQSILTYHVVGGKVVAGDVLKLGEATTVEGSPAKFGLTIGGANIIKTDIKCSNGVIHVIDAVIMPPKKMAKKVSASVNPRMMIENVIANGSRLYNSGHACQCADLYTQAMTDLSQHSSVDTHIRAQIQNTMTSAQHAANSDSRAWVLRRGLDSVYAQLRR